MTAAVTSRSSRSEAMLRIAALSVLIAGALAERWFLTSSAMFPERGRESEITGNSHEVWLRKASATGGGMTLRAPQAQMSARTAPASTEASWSLSPSQDYFGIGADRFHKFCHQGKRDHEASSTTIRPARRGFFSCAGIASCRAGGRRSEWIVPHGSAQVCP